MPKVAGNVRYNADVFEDGDGFRYLQNRRGNGRVYVRCVKHPICSGRGIYYEATEAVQPTKPHNHQPANNAVKDLKNLLKAEASINIGTASNSEIFRQVTRHHASGTDVAFPSIESSMQRAKRRTHPRLPESASDLVDILSGQGPDVSSFNMHLQGVVRDQESNSVALIFFHQSLHQVLSAVTDFNFDGTFYTVPALFYQLFTLLGVYLGHVFPLVHVLMTSKTTRLYELTLSKVKDLLPSFNPLTAMGDFESSSGKAFRAVFPQLQIGGCQFHFSQSLFRKIQNLGLAQLYIDNRQFNKWTRKLMALSYVPAERMVEAAQHLFEQRFDVNDHTATKIESFKAYVQRYWLGKVTPQKLSVFSFSRGTNNDAESYHSKLKATIRQHKPNVFSFLSHLNNIIQDTQNDVLRLETGLQITRPRKQKFVKNSERRERCKQMLQDNSYTLKQYLDAIIYTFDATVPEFCFPPGNDSDTEDQDGSGEIVGSREDVPPELLCGICMQRRQRTVVILPCQHGSYCADCIAILVASASPENPAKCPTCRTQIQDRLEVYQ